ncbi:MAG: helix-turn-helix domain-containing protein [Saprospiraceae bacterium]|nr:helix-turn-helix domain-containing protein [Saprospiraceae bacterium]
MKKPFVSKIILLIVLFSTFREIICQSPIDTIDWAYHQKLGCTEIKEKIAYIDTSATAQTFIEACRCALKLKDGSLALNYIKMAQVKGYEYPIVINILKVRSHAILREDQKAVNILKAISKKIELFNVMEVAEIRELRMRNTEAMAMYHNSRPSFDYFTFIISVICFLGYFVGILFLIKSIRWTQLKWLSFFVLNFSIIMTSYVLYWTKFHWTFPYLNEWWHPLYFLIGPIFYFYIKNITGFNISIGNIILHFFPFIFCTVIFALNGLFFQLAYSGNGSGFLVSIFQNMPLKLISLGLYFTLSAIIINGDWMVDQNVKIWMQYLFGFFGVFILANVVYYICTFSDGFNRDWDYAISAIMAMGIIGVSTMGFLESKYLSFAHPFKSVLSNMIPKNDQLTDILHNEEPDPAFIKYKTSTLTTSAANSIKLKLEKLMTEHQLYQREELRLQDVADQVGLHRNQVSQVINENYNLNFFEWVNRYRIYHAADLLSIPKCPKTISQIGFESGFNNKVTFYKTFRQYFQCTPLEYVARLERDRASMS